MDRDRYSERDEGKFSSISRKSIKPNPDVSMFGQSSGLADVTFIVENVRIPVIKALLSLTSPVFRAMFEGEWRENFQDEIPLPGKMMETFIPFLRCIHPDLKDRVTAANATSILPLAWEYQIVKLMEQCEDCILALTGDIISLDMSCDNLCKYLQLAEQCDRRRLKAVCFARISSFCFSERKEKTSKYNISKASEIEIAELVFKRHELLEADVIPVVSVEALSKRIRGLPLVSKSGYYGPAANKEYFGPAVGELFKSLRLSYYVCGRTSQDYKQLLERMCSACQYFPKEAPKCSDFEHLPYALKYDLQQIIPSFQQQF